MKKLLYLTSAIIITSFASTTFANPMCSQQWGGNNIHDSSQSQQKSNQNANQGSQGINEKSTSNSSSNNRRNNRR